MDSKSHGKIGRNDPCTCGSGKKYKHCCLQAIPISADSLWARANEAADQLNQQMMKYAHRKFGENVQEAWEEFNLEEFCGAYEPDSDQNTIFVPYFLYCWEADCADRNRKAPPRGGTIVQSFLLDYGNRLSELQLQMLNQAMTQPISFYEVLSCEPGARIALRDVLTGWKALVAEQRASEYVEPGDILFAQVWPLPGISILGCCAPDRLPPDWKVDIITLRANLRKRVARQRRDLGAEDLVRYADEIRSLYLSFLTYSKTPPQVENTDGDPLVLHTLKFRIESAESALEALIPLAGGRSREDLLKRAEFDETGKIRNVEFEWIKMGNRKFTNWDNTILGHIRITKDSLIADLNSVERARKLRKEIEKRIGMAAVLQDMRTQSLEELLENSPAGGENRTEAGMEDVLLDPEVRKRAQESLQKEVEAWVHRKVPALAGRTPLQAVQDAEGREMVEALLMMFERRAMEKSLFGGLSPDIGAVRKLLKLAPPAP
jgi:hypothetical protein